MIICGECGTRNAPGTQFCGDCGTFLEWEGDPAEAGTAQAAQAPAQAPAPATAAAAPAGAGAPPLTHPPAEAVPAETVQAADPAPPRQPQAPQLVQPGDRRQRYQAATTDEPRAVAPGEVVCRHCGAGNAATRKFCRSCAGALAEEVAPVRRSWWRRLLDRLGTRRSYEAGTRRQVRAPRGWPRRLVILAIVVAVVVAAVTVLPTRGLINRGVTAARDRISDHAPLTPVAVRASSSARGAAAGNVSDGVSNKYWAPTGSPVGAWVEADFERPVRLLEVIMHAGVSDDKQLFLAQGRPAEVEVTVTNEAGGTTVSTIVVQDKPGEQTFAIKASDTVRVRFTISSSYGMPPGRLCGIGELEFFIRG